MQNVVIQGRSYQYLVNQRGELDHLRDKPAEWYQAYHAELQKTIQQIGHWCRAPQTVLDIGSGLGVIDMLLMKEVGSQCVLVDGEDGDGEAHNKYDVPFNSRDVVREFMDDNGIPDRLWTYYNPEQLADDAEFPVFDLVVSFRSWCFHYPPEAYLWFVQKHVVADTRVILDVRHKREWRDRLNAVWKESFVIEQSEKFDRVCFVVGGRKQ